VLNDRYKIVEAIAMAGWRVYKALQAPLERVVALKIWAPATIATRTSTSASS